MGHMGGLINPAPGVDNTEPVFQIPVGLPSLERGRHKKGSLFCINFSSHGELEFGSYLFITKSNNLSD